MKSEFVENIKGLSNDQLLVSLEEKFATERTVSHHILLHLKEVRLRRLYAERGFPNLFSMLVQHFHQSESAANQRLKALDLMMDVPVVEERLVSGDLNLSTVAMAQRQIKREEKLTGKKVSKEKKVEIVESITKKTMAQAETELFKLLPETASNPQTFERRISQNLTRMSLNFPDDVVQMMNELKAIWAHVDPTMDPVEVIRRSFKIALEKVDPARRAKRKAIKEAHANYEGGANHKRTANYEGGANHNRTPNHEEKSSTHALSDQLQESNIYSAQNSKAQTKNTHPQPTRSLTESAKHCGTKRLTYYKREIDRVLWKRANSRCEFVDPITGRRCDCRFGLQREHVIPLALGGSNEISNMQLLCATHNQLRARNVFGDKKIDFYQQR